MLLTLFLLVSFAFISFSLFSFKAPSVKKMLIVASNDINEDTLRSLKEQVCVRDTLECFCVLKQNEKPNLFIYQCGWINHSFVVDTNTDIYSYDRSLPCSMFDLVNVYLFQFNYY